MQYGCKFQHPPEHHGDCRNGGKCTRLSCDFLHPPDHRAPAPGSSPVEHPPGQRDCRNGVKCSKRGCQFLHPPDWDPMPADWFQSGFNQPAARAIHLQARAQSEPQEPAQAAGVPTRFDESAPVPSHGRAHVCTPATHVEDPLRSASSARRIPIRLHRHVY